jgi:hypothetical protein
MHASLVPSTYDLAGLLAYVLGNPFLFISSSTWMTTGILLGAVALSIVPRSSPVLRLVAPPLAMVLLYFGAGSMALATQILVRFHAVSPDAAETQFASGIGHLLAASAGIAILFPYLRGRSRRAWILSNAAAVVYWTAQILVLNPPWLAFGNQLDFTRPVALGALASGALVSVIFWRFGERRRARRDSDGGAAL